MRHVHPVKGRPFKEGVMHAFRIAAGIAIVLMGAAPGATQNAPPGAYPPAVQYAPPAQQRGAPPPQYSSNEVLDAGHRFFGGVSRGLAGVIEKAVSQWGLPNGYVLGQEGGGAFFAGLRYGEGTLYTKNAGDLL